MIKSLLKNCKFERLKASQSAGTTVVTSDVLDMAGFESVLIKVILGTVTEGGSCTVKVQGCDTSGGTYVDLEGTSIQNTGSSDSDNYMLVEIINSKYRYLKVVATRADANVEIDSIDAIQFGAKALPVSQGSDVDVSEQHATPDEGTA